MSYEERMTQKTEIHEFKSLLDSLQILPLWIIAPNKAHFYKEFITQPLNFKTSTNQAELKQICESAEVPVIDVDSWFIAQKGRSKYPLVPKYGAHWTTFGAALVADSLDHFLRSYFPKKVKTSIGKVEERRKAKFSDNDYLPSLNLIQKWDWDTILGYPAMVYEAGEKVKALIVSDSYMWNFYHNDFFQQNFTADSKFLYYNEAYYDVNQERLGEK